MPSSNPFATIRARRAKITPGPWALEPHSDTDERLDVVADATTLPDGKRQANWIAECDLGDGQIEQNEANADFIAHAPEDIDTLLAEVERLQKGVLAGERISQMYEREIERLQRENERLRADADVADRLVDKRLKGA